MRGLSYLLIVVGVVVLIIGVANHWVMKANPFPHTSAITAGVGAVLAVIGVVVLLMGGSSSAKA